MVIGLVGGLVLTRGGLERTDVWLEGDTVIGLGSARALPDSVIDVAGMIVGPGLVDMHAHLRDPGQTWKEDLRSGTAAAAAGGFTAVVAMPNTDPPTDDPERYTAMADRARLEASILVVPAATITRGRMGSEPVDIAALCRVGARVFTDDGDWVADEGVLESFMREAATLGVLVAQHAEDPVLSAGGHMHQGPDSARMGVAGIPVTAETEAVERDLTVASRTGALLHVQHVSAARSVELVREARDAGVSVSMEVTPHHVDLDVGSVANTNHKMYPPLRDSSDRQALARALASGEIEVVATDHAPHAVEEKSVSFDEAPRGVIGLETAASVVWGVCKDPEILFSTMSVNPARLAGLDRHGRPISAGEPANLVVFDPDRRWTPGAFSSKSRNSPYIGRELTGKPVLTVFEGSLVHSEIS